MGTTAKSAAHKMRSRFWYPKSIATGARRRKPTCHSRGHRPALRFTSCSSVTKSSCLRRRSPRCRVSRSLPGRCSRTLSSKPRGPVSQPGGGRAVAPPWAGPRSAQSPGRSKTTHRRRRFRAPFRESQGPCSGSGGGTVDPAPALEPGNGREELRAEHDGRDGANHRRLKPFSAPEGQERQIAQDGVPRVHVAGLPSVRRSKT